MGFMVFIFFLLSALSFSAHSYEGHFYGGADVQHTKTPFQKQFGGNFVPKGASGANPFIGVNLNEYFALELGYQYTRAIRTCTLEGGDWIAGFRLPAAISPITLKSSIRIEGPNINLMINSPKFFNSFQAFGGIGISQNRFTITRRTMQYNMYIGTAMRFFESSRNIRRLTLGTNYFLSHDIALRFSTTFLKYDRFSQFTVAYDYHFLKQVIKSKNGIAYSMGVRWDF